MGFGWHPIYEMENKIHVPNHQLIRFIEFADFPIELNILHLRGISLFAVIPYLGYPFFGVAALQSCETPRHIVMIKVPQDRSPAIGNFSKGKTLSSCWIKPRLVVGWWYQPTIGW